MTVNIDIGATTLASGSVVAAHSFFVLRSSSWGFYTLFCSWCQAEQTGPRGRF